MSTPLWRAIHQCNEMINWSKSSKIKITSTTNAGKKFIKCAAWLNGDTFPPCFYDLLKKQIEQCMLTLAIKPGLCAGSYDWCLCHYIDVIMTTMASQITSLVVVYSTVYAGSDQRRHQSSAWPLRREFTGTGEFPAQRASNAEHVSIWWRHHGIENFRMTVPVW